MFCLLRCCPSVNKWRFYSFKLDITCIAIDNGVPWVHHISLQDVTLLLHVFDPLCLSMLACLWTGRVYSSEMCNAPAVTCMRWFVWTAAAHIKYNSSNVHLRSRSQALYSNWIWPFFLFFCVCVCLWHIVSMEIYSTLPLFLQQPLDVSQCELCHE